MTCQQLLRSTKRSTALLRSVSLSPRYQSSALSSLLQLSLKRSEYTNTKPTSFSNPSLRYHSTCSKPGSFKLPDPTFDSFKAATTVPRLSQHLIPASPPVTDDPLIQHGYVRQVSSGVYHLLPLARQVQTNLENLLRKHMNAVGGVEVSLSTLSLPKLWERTGRSGNTELFRLKDSRGGNEHILAPTHEEEITNLIANNVSSYRQLPLRLFQISRKYRDEKRPRGGLLRGKEFLMKDMYSFDKTAEEAVSTYKDVQQAYNAFFEEVGVPFVVAEADTGAIGGSLSHEYHYLSAVGEDTVATCESCKFTANVEKAIADPPEAQRGTEKEEAAVAYFVSPDENRETLVAAYYPKDREFSVLHLMNELPEETVDLEVFENTPKAIEQLKKLKKSDDTETTTTKETEASEPETQSSANDLALSYYLETAKAQDDSALLTRRFIRVMDSRLNRHTPLPELPFRANRGSTTTLVDVPLVMAQDGDACPECGEESLRVARAIEIGHTFYLGTKYSAPLNASVTLPNGSDAETVPIEMGCYGIGVSRLLAAITSITKDSDGLVWPASIAPYHVVVVSKDAEVGSSITNSLRTGLLSSTGPEEKQQEKGGDSKRPIINAVWDDRPATSFGASLRDARALGFPVTVVAGKRFAETGKVEIQLRSMSVDEIKKAAKEESGNKFEATLEELPFKLEQLLKL